mmetsp:Transcript_65615/g.156547  ORF Transcript_65615/g.156547 Transcript_65615/m.156547 type:complete len:205 (-) Transcript_65615:728-1342(-)
MRAADRGDKGAHALDGRAEQLHRRRELHQLREVLLEVLDEVRGVVCHHGEHLDVDGRDGPDQLALIRLPWPRVVAVLLRGEMLVQQLHVLGDEARLHAREQRQRAEQPEQVCRRAGHTRVLALALANHGLQCLLAVVVARLLVGGGGLDGIAHEALEDVGDGRRVAPHGGCARVRRVHYRLHLLEARGERQRGLLPVTAVRRAR